MTLHRKKPRPLSRQDRPTRDARIIVIATEDTYAPQRYFRLFRNPRIHTRVLPTQGGLSSPKDVLDRLNKFLDESKLLEDDEFWLMLDTDHWIEPSHIGNFNQVCTEALQKGYQLAHSNPCFEFWLLLHVLPLKGATQFDRCAAVKERLKGVLGEYTKNTIDIKRFSHESIRNAIEQAEALDSAPGARWPDSTGTHVYKVVRKLL
jgi:hypothetical protein